MTASFEVSTNYNLHSSKAFELNLLNPKMSRQEILCYLWSEKKTETYQNEGQFLIHMKYLSWIILKV